MSRLSELRQQLNRLHRLRRGARLGTAWCSVVLAVLWGLAILFLVDWALEMTRAQRVICILALAGAVYWAYRRFAAPLLLEGESLLDVALLVERQQHIDSDLVAALQFETTDAQRWGSVQLEEAVIEYVADFSSGLNVFEGFNREQMVRRGLAVGLTLAVLLLAAVIFPIHAKTFFSRLFLSNAHYPTRTQIATIWINGQEVAVTPGSNEPVRCAYGLPLSIEVACTGELPESGLATLASYGGLSTEVILDRKGLMLSPGSDSAPDKSSPAAEKKPTAQANAEIAAKAVSNPATSTAALVDPSAATKFAGTLPRLVDSLEFQLYLGDAWTEPAVVQVIPLPKVEFTLQPTPPKYARQAEDASSASSARQFAVVEGSRVDLEVTSDKQLATATLTIDEQTYPLERKPGESADTLDHWVLQVKGTPLETVLGPLAYQIEARDTDGLEPSQPIQGFIRLRADRAPRVFGTIRTRNVQPLAKQPITFNATDDFGVNTIRLHLQVTRKEGSAPEERVLEIRKPGQPELRVEGTYRLDLGKLNLVKGDQVAMTLEAVDFRGQQEGRSAQSEPLTMFITDKMGVQADVLELDEQAARQMETVIKLGFGDKP